MFGIPTMHIFGNLMMLFLIGGITGFIWATWRSMTAQEAISLSLKEILEIIKIKDSFK